MLCDRCRVKNGVAMDTVRRSFTQVVRDVSSEDIDGIPMIVNGNFPKKAILTKERKIQPIQRIMLLKLTKAVCIALLPLLVRVDSRFYYIFTARFYSYKN